MRSISLASLTLIMVVSVTGCGASKTLKPADRAAISSVSVDPAVKVTNEPMVVGSEAGLSILFGAAGSAIAADSEKKGVGDFSEFLSASGIDIKEIVRRQFTERLKRHEFYGSRLSTDGAYRFELKVPSYGINKVNTFSSHWMANLRIDYKLVAPDGRVLAEDWAVAPLFGDRQEFTMEELQSNPQVLRQAFEGAASAVSADLMKK